MEMNNLMKENTKYFLAHLTYCTETGIEHIEQIFDQTDKTARIEKDIINAIVKNGGSFIKLDSNRSKLLTVAEVFSLLDLSICRPDEGIYNHNYEEAKAFVSEYFGVTYGQHTKYNEYLLFTGNHNYESYISDSIQTIMKSNYDLRNVRDIKLIEEHIEIYRLLYLMRDFNETCFERFININLKLNLAK